MCSPFCGYWERSSCIKGRHHHDGSAELPSFHQTILGVLENSISKTSSKGWHQKASIMHERIHRDHHAFSGKPHDQCMVLESPMISPLGSYIQFWYTSQHHMTSMHRGVTIMHACIWSEDRRGHSGGHGSILEGNNRTI